MSNTVKVFCAACREELMGVVNRCWKCGATFPPLAGPSDLPPVRRPPPADLAAMPPGAAQASPMSGRSGSPFRPASPLQLATSAATTSAAADVASAGPAGSGKARWSGGELAVAAGIVAGLAAAVVTLSFPLGGLLLGGLGVTCGVLGMSSRRNGWGMGIVIGCCLLMGWNVLRILVEVYEQLGW